MATPHIMQCLQNPEENVRLEAIEGLSSFAARCMCFRLSLLTRLTMMIAELHGEVRTVTLGIVERLNDSEVSVRKAAIEWLSNLSAARMCPRLPPLTCSTMIIAELHEEIRIAILGIEQCLKNFDASVREAAVKGLSNLAAHCMCYHHSRLAFSTRIVAKLDEEIQKATSSLRQCLNDSEESVCVAAIQGLSSFAVHRMCHRRSPSAYSTMIIAELHGEIRSAIPRIVNFLKHWYFPVQEAAVKGLSILVAHRTSYDLTACPHQPPLSL